MPTQSNTNVFWYLNLKNKNKSQYMSEVARIFESRQKNEN